MKKIFSLLLAASAFACTQEKVVEITISNPSTTDRTNEITEITSDAITKLKGETFIISDNTGSPGGVGNVYVHLSGCPPGCNICREMADDGADISFILIPK